MSREVSHLIKKGSNLSAGLNQNPLQERILTMQDKNNLRPQQKQTKPAYRNRKLRDLKKTLRSQNPTNQRQQSNPFLPSAAKEVK
jgi:hypothetical protein